MRARWVWALPALTIALVIAMLVLGDDSDGVMALSGSVPPVAFAVAGAVITSRKPRNGIGWVLWLFSLTVPAEELATAWLAQGGNPGPVLTAVLWVVGWMWAPLLVALLTYLPTTFPDGTVTSRATRLTLVLASVGAAMVVVGNALGPQSWYGGGYDNPFALQGHDELLVSLTAYGMLPVAMALIASAVILIRRYRRSTGVLRMQLKWFAFAMVVAIVSAVANAVLYEQGRPDIGHVVFGVGFVWLPVALGVAIVRHNLYDIDRLVSRTVSYALVTAVVVGVYLASVTTATAVTSPVTGRSPLTTAAATLLAASAFRPLRRRIQSTVDRRFNRARFDAQAAADTYRIRLRDQLELDGITTELLAVVGATVQPRTTHLWMADRAVQR